MMICVIHAHGHETGKYTIKMPAVSCSGTEQGASDTGAGGAAVKARVCLQATRIEIALGSVRPESATPSAEASVLKGERHLVYFRGQLVQVSPTLSSVSVHAHHSRPPHCARAGLGGAALVSLWMQLTRMT